MPAARGCAASLRRCGATASGARLGTRRARRYGELSSSTGGGAIRLDLQRVQPAAVGAQDAEAEAADRRRLAALRQPAERLQHEAADGVELVVGERRAELRVEVVDLGLRLDAETAVGLGDDVVLALVEVVFVLDVADDLLEHVLDRDEARHAAVLVDDDRDVVAVGAEVAQQHVEALRLGHEHGGPQRLAQVEALRARVVVAAAPSRAGCRRRRP